MEGVQIRILDSIFLSLYSRHSAVQIRMHGQTKNGILKNVTNSGMFLTLPSGIQG